MDSNWMFEHGSHHSTVMESPHMEGWVQQQQQQQQHASSMSPMHQQVHLNQQQQKCSQSQGGSNYNSPSMNIMSPAFNNTASNHHTPINDGSVGQIEHSNGVDGDHTPGNTHFSDYLNGDLDDGSHHFAMMDEPSTAKDDWTDIANLHELNDIDMNFFPDDLATQQQQINGSKTKHESIPIHEKVSDHVPPTPTSFEVASYANPHFMESFDSPMLDHQGSASIRTDVVFTPLVSPAVTPMDSIMNNNQNKQVGFFSPLTSPALEAKSPRRLKKTSSNDEQQQSQSQQKKKYTKRKTPGSTPINS
ncbi:hypothetical protein BN1211_6216 [Cyberlindnera jadinii]|uniref:Uncharacterized protein n=1 Tax=Cyberlindnera jadinii (strain ATCC 18201 / CBS 1600 / BCRC 20928 / JCM 3617 / NBRC 0987 / NRRL Y-1542) TaxID=983966 RepID=A0A0H5C9U2_CYBJN|nr:hypothetical protein BN1211_6216 [Cyberlindnera jadinii]